MSNEIPVTIRFDPAVQAEMKRLADTHKRSFNSEVEWALQEYIKKEKRTMKFLTPEQEQVAINNWANASLEEATDFMTEAKIEITPENLSTYFEKHNELPFTPEEAGEWLSKQDWYNS